MMKFRKVKDTRKCRIGNKSERSDKQIESARERMKNNNPMWDEKNRQRQRESVINGKSGKLFETGNEFWKKRKSHKLSQSTRAKIGIKLSGHKGNINQKLKATERMKFGNNPMKDPFIVEKWRASRMKKKMQLPTENNAVGNPEINLDAVEYPE